MWAHMGVDEVDDKKKQRMRDAKKMVAEANYAKWTARQSFQIEAEVSIVTEEEVQANEILGQTVGAEVNMVEDTHGNKVDLVGDTHAILGDRSLH